MGIVVSVAALVLYVPMSMVFVLGGKNDFRAAGVPAARPLCILFSRVFFSLRGRASRRAGIFFGWRRRRAGAVPPCSARERAAPFHTAAGRSAEDVRTDPCALCFWRCRKRLAAARTVALFSTIHLASSHARSSLFVCIMHHSPSGISSICAEGSSYENTPGRRKNLPGATKMGSFECVRRCAGRAPANRNACSAGDAQHNK